MDAKKMTFTQLPDGQWVAEANWTQSDAEVASLRGLVGRMLDALADCESCKNTGRLKNEKWGHVPCGWCRRAGENLRW